MPTIGPSSPEFIFRQLNKHTLRWLPRHQFRLHYPAVAEYEVLRFSYRNDTLPLDRHVLTRSMRLKRRPCDNIVATRAIVYLEVTESPILPLRLSYQVSLIFGSFRQMYLIFEGRSYV